MFKRTIEDFTCAHCGTPVIGTGYTNHCPQCLWSKHVDITPGDRLAQCQGMMRPVSLEGSTPHYRIVQLCEKCKITRTIIVAPNDSPDSLTALASARA